MSFDDMQQYETDQRYAICQSKWEEKLASQKISFDYDGVLSTQRGKMLADSKKETLYIISARHDKKGMLSTAKMLNIPESRVYATGSNKAKVEKIKELGIDKHYDNNPDVISELPNIGILFK
jgi:hypothetical protein